MIILALVEAGADFEANNSDGLIPLLQVVAAVAAMFGRSVAGMKALIEAGFSSDARFAGGHTPLAFTIRRLREKAVDGWQDPTEEQLDWLKSIRRCCCG